MGYTLDFNEQVRLGMVDADEPPACRGCGDLDCAGDCVQMQPCPGCGRLWCDGECPEFRLWLMRANAAVDATAWGRGA